MIEMPTRSPSGEPENAHFRGLAVSIMERAEAELARRRSLASLNAVLTQWSRPVLSAAAGLILVGGALLGFQVRQGAAETLSVPTMAEVLIPEDLAPWYYDGNETTLTELVSHLEGAVQ